MPSVDVVVVSYNSSSELRSCLEPLAGQPGIRVIAVDNASTDGSLDAIADLPVEQIALERNGGFGHGCNVGWRRAAAPCVLFLNPDARIEPDSVERLAAVLDETPAVGAVAPRITEADGTLDY